MSDIFKPLKIEERLEPKRKELVDKGIITIDNSTKVLTFKGDMEYKEYFILYTFYKDYIVDVEGYVNLFNSNLSSIGIQFNKTNGHFYCNFNNLTSLHNCPKVVGGNFYCKNNKLILLEGCPKLIKGDFYCKNNPKQFTKEEVLNVCDVKGKIFTKGVVW